MPIKVRCPSCKKVLNAPDAARGKAVRCPGCQGVVKIPAAAAAPAEESLPKSAQESTEFLLSIKTRDAIDRNANVCPKCGSDMEEDQTECTVCGIDITTGELGKTALKARKKGVDSSEFMKNAWSDPMRFVGKNKGLMFRTMFYSLMSLTFTALFYLWYLWCYRIPPKMAAAAFTFLTSMTLIGWPWQLYLKVLAAAFEKKDKIKRIHYDFFSSVALGIKFLAWTVAFGLPGVILSLVMLWVFSASGQGAVGSVLALLVMAIFYLPFPAAMAHMAMPVQTPAWLIPKMFPLMFRLLKPTLYWWVVVVTVNLPLIAGVGAAAALYGPKLNEIVTEIEDQNHVLREHFNLSLTKEGKGAPKPEEKPWPDLMVMLIPLGILAGCALYWGFSGVFSVRALVLYVNTMKKNMDLTTEAPEFKFQERSKTPTRKVRPVTTPVLNGWLVFLALSWYPVLGALGMAKIWAMEEPLIWMIVGGLLGMSTQFALAGKWVAYQKFGVPGWTSMIPIYNAFVLMQMAGWETKYFPMMVFPWIRRAVMYDVAERWGRDRMSFGIGLTAFPFAYWPMLGWNRQLHTNCYVPREWDPTGQSKAAPSSHGE